MRLVAASLLLATAFAAPASNFTAGDPSLFVHGLDASPPSVDAAGWVSFKQCDSSWGSSPLGSCSQTICSAGCAMTSVAMLLATRGVGTNPGDLNKWLLSNGGYADGCDIVWSSVDKFGKTSFQGIETASFSTICSGVGSGHGVVANVRDGSHWVLITGCQGSDTFLVNDPGFDQSTYTYGDVLREAVYH